MAVNKWHSSQFGMRSIWTVALVSLLLACQPVQDKPEGLVYCSQGSPSTLNPQLSTSSTVVEATSFQIYNRLLSISDDGIELLPELAHRWDVNYEGTLYTFHLRPNITFHHNESFSPTRTLTADDVVFSFERITNKDHPYHDVGGSDYTFFNSVGLPLLIKSVTAIDQLTVQFELFAPDSTFLTNLATDFSVILSAEYGEHLEKLGLKELLDKRPIGTGPYRFHRYKTGSYIKFKRHESYWKGPASLSDLVYDITPNSTMRLAKLLTGECDVMAFPLASDLNLIRSKPQLKVQYRTGFNLGYWAFNTDKPPLDDVKVRRALSMAIDRVPILEAVYYGTASLSTGILPPASWAYDGLLEGISYNPEQAKALLAQAGYPKGLELDIWVMPVQRAYNPNPRKMALMIQENLRQIGVKANLVSHEWGVFRARLSRGEHDSVLLGWAADNADPDNFFRPLLSCQAKYARTNRALWCDPYFDRLIDLARQSRDKEERLSLYWMAQNHLNEQAPLLPIAHGMRMQALRDQVSQLQVKSFGGIDFYNVTLE